MLVHASFSFPYDYFSSVSQLRNKFVTFELISVNRKKRIVDKKRTIIYGF